MREHFLGYYSGYYYNVFHGNVHYHLSNENEESRELLSFEVQ
jgi:hypothetical protein